MQALLLTAALPIEYFPVLHDVQVPGPRLDLYEPELQPLQDAWTG
jgi:hypothetical protein